MPRSRFRAIVVATAAVSVVSVAPAQASTVLDFGDGLTLTASGVGFDVRILPGPTPQDVRIEEYDPDDDLTEAAANCEHTGDTDADADPEVVVCTGVTPLKVVVFGSHQIDSIESDPTVTFPVEMYGYGGNDILLGGGGNDRLAGYLGDDDVDGREGSDLVDNGYDGSGSPVDGDGADTYADTGTTGVDSLNYGFTGAGVQMFVGNGPLSGVPGENDTIGDGFEQLRGSPHDDHIIGGPAVEKINGSAGDDTITGGGGADILEGNGGNDTLNAISGDVDDAILCDSPSDPPGTVGTADVAYLDENPADPQPVGCETLLGPGGNPWAPGGGTPTPPAGGGTPTPPPGGSGTPTPSPTPPALVLGAPVSTKVVSRMPRVTGRSFTAARTAVLKAIPAADLDLEFRRGCKSSSDLEIVKQSPATNAMLPNHAMDPVAVKLTTCLADKDFLRDCDLKDLRTDVRKLPKSALDAEVGLEFAKSVGKCKIDYDIKIVKAATEARVKLEAQKAQAEKELKTKADRAALAKKKAELRVGLSCPAAGPLRIKVADGYTPNRRAMGLRASGPGGWKLPAEFDAFIEVTLLDAAFQFIEATVYTDADAVSYLKVPPKVTKDGRVQISVKPYKGPGKIRMCVVLETGDDEVATAAVEIDVVKRPANGTVWETTSGRRLQVTKDGVVLAKAASTPTARAAAGLGDIWDAIVALFSGRSRSITAAGAGGTVAEKSVKLKDTYEGPKYGAGQISLNGKLSQDPARPVIVNGPCISVQPDGTLRALTCPQLQAPGGTALVGSSLGGVGLVAAGGGNVVRATKGNLIGNDGATLIGNDGATLIGNDGATLIGNDGATLIGNDGGTLVAAGGGNAIATAPAQLVAAGGGNLVPGPAGGLVPPGGTG
jgi:Ca2+-binding RTX toxin-like protein